MVELGRGAFEWIVALVDEDRLKVEQDGLTWCINRHLLLSVRKLRCKEKRNLHSGSAFFSADI